jgi:glucosamine-6-phosphate deaminase
MNKMNIDNLSISSFASRKEMGRAAANDLAEIIKELHQSKETISIVFASALSQNEFLRELRMISVIEWNRIHCFHLDEYVGLSPDAPQRFSQYLREELFGFRQPLNFFAIDPSNTPEEECRRYTELLQRYPLDIACIGIGENGHIAFNDPHVADFHDAQMIKKVELDEASRQQQVHDECFSHIDQVPREALTLTIPTILSANHIICTVPGRRKRDAVQKTIFGPIDVSCPASVLRTARSCHLFLDHESEPIIHNS